MTKTRRGRRAGLEWPDREHLRSALFDSAPFAMALTRMPEGITVEVNDAFLKLFECSRKELLGNSSVDLGISTPDQRAEVGAEPRRAGSVRNLEMTRKAKSGSPLYLSINIDRFRVAGKEHVLTTIQDITERKQAEEALRQAHAQLEDRVLERTAELRASEQSLARANRSLRAIIACNEASLRATSEAELFRKICRIIVKVGGYRLAWVGLAEHSKEKRVLPVAHDGNADHYLERPQITWAQKSRGRGPAGTAIRTRKPVILRDLTKHPGFAPWRRFARKLGSACAIGLPLLDDEGCFGALTIFASEPDAFDADEVKLLTRLADDLAFGVTALRSQTLRKELEKEILQITEREQRRIGQDLHDGLGQRIVGARLMCSALAHQFAEDKLPAAPELARVERELAEALRDTRRIARGLHPVETGAESLVPALYELAETITNNFRIPCLFICHEPAPVTDHEAATHLYRIAQEATSNAARHGRPTQIRITLASVNGGTRLRIEDDGRGLPAKEKRGSGLGIGIMRYRASVIGASIAIAPRRAGGTVVTCHWKCAVGK